MFGKDLLETLKILKNPEVAKEKVNPAPRSSELSILERADRFTNEGQVPPNAAKDDINTIIKKLTEMAVREEAPADAPKDKLYFGSSGQNTYYALVDKDEMSKQIKSLKIYDVTDSEIKSYENLQDTPNAEIIYNAVNDLNLDSVSYQLLVDLDLLKKPEDEKPAEEPKKEEKPAEEPESEEPPAEEPAPEEEEEVEEPVEDSVQVGETVVSKVDLAESPVKKGVKGKIKAMESAEKIVVEFEVGDQKIEKLYKLAEMKDAVNRIVKKKVKEAAVDTNQEPKKDPVLKTDGDPAAAPKVDDKGAAGTDAAPVKQGDSSINKDQNAGGAADPNLNKDNMKKEGDAKLNDQDPAKVAAQKPVDVPKLDGIKVIKDAKEFEQALTLLKEAHKDKELVFEFKADEILVKIGEEVVFTVKHTLSEADLNLAKDNIKPAGAKPAEVKQDTGAIDKGNKTDGDKKVNPDGTTIVADSKLDVQKPEEYKKAVDELKAKLEKGEMTEEEFKKANYELDQKFKAAPAGATEGKLPANPSGVADDKMIDTLLEKYGLLEKRA